MNTTELVPESEWDDPSKYLHHYAQINGLSMHYVTAKPFDPSKRSIVLCHGWPDLWYGWRKQIHTLSNVGYNVIAPDLRGFGETTAPKKIEDYSILKITSDLLFLLDFLKIEKAIFLGHDHGGIVVWRMCLFHPKRVFAVGSICTAYTPPKSTFVSLQKLVEILPVFKYQLYLNTDESRIEFEENTEKFFKIFMRGTKSDKPKQHSPQPHTPKSDSELFLAMKNGPPLLKPFPDNFKKSPFLSQTALDYYVSQYKKSGFGGGLNWYKTFEVNFEAEKNIKDHKINVPALMITAGKDEVLKPELTSKMELFIPSLSRGNVPDGNHWVHQEWYQEVNGILLSWLKKLSEEKRSNSGAKL